MKEKKSTHGGTRPNQTGRPPIPIDQKKTTISFYITPANLKFISEQPEGRSGYLNALIEKARGEN